VVERVIQSLEVRLGEAVTLGSFSREAGFVATVEAQ
jgi:hypothetical protein